MRLRAFPGLGALPLLVAVGVAAGISACDELQRHAVVDFVFDGVPPYLPPEERARLAAEVAARARAEAEAEAARRSRRYKPGKKLARFTHGPFAAKECSRCHDLGAASGFRGPGGGGATDPTSGAELAQVGRLRMPVVQLCVHCHAEFRRDDPVNADLWLHGPVGSGWCVICHQSHSSFYPHLLHTEPPARLCGQCHLRPDLVAFTPEHIPRNAEEAYPPAPASDEASGRRGAEEEQVVAEQVQVVKDCIRCHDPHRGRDRFLLKGHMPQEPAEAGREQVAWGASGQ